MTERMNAEAIRFWGRDQGKDPAKIEAYIDECNAATWRDGSIEDPKTDARYYPTRDAIAGDFAMHFPDPTKISTIDALANSDAALVAGHPDAAIVRRQINEVSKQFRGEQRAEKRRAKEAQPRIDFEDEVKP